MNRIKTRGGIAKFRKSHRTLPSPCSSPLASSPASSSSLTPTTSTLTSRPTVLPEPVTKRRKTGPMGVPPPILTYLAPPPHHHPHFTPNQPSHQPPPKQTLFTPESLISTIHLPSLPVLIATYIHRIWHSTSSSPTPPPSFLSFTHKTLSLSSLPTSTILYALRLIHRLTIAHPTLTGAPGSECRLLVCALLTAMKCTCDHTYTNKTWERVCGIPGDEINVMEREFLGKLEWRVFVGSDEFWEFVGELEEFMESLPTPSPAQLNATSGTTSRPPSSNLMMMIPSPPISPLHHLPHSARLLSYPSYPYVSYYPSHHNHHTHQVYHRNIVV
ncbi:hypothetical protein DFS34DRAFT_633959 [Phlyctochytrium arcticum]|nr:hypothetical protein DFS34DRAFT_633959 [Phlyctochytrium arcticum]